MHFGEHPDFNPVLGLRIQRTIKNDCRIPKFVVNLIRYFYDTHIRYVAFRILLYKVLTHLRFFRTTAKLQEEGIDHENLHNFYRVLCPRDFHYRMRLG